MASVRSEPRPHARRASRDPPKPPNQPVAWLTWCAVTLVIGAAVPPRAWPTHPVMLTSGACAAVGALALAMRHALALKVASWSAASLCLASCCLFGVALRQRADGAWHDLVRHIVPDSTPRLVEVVGIAIKPPSSDERSHLGDAWGDILSRFTPASPASSLDVRMHTPYGPATIRIRVDGHRMHVLAGDRVRATGWVRGLGAATNPGGFDGERWSASRRIVAIMDAESPTLVVSEGPDPGLDGILARWRACVEDHLHRSMPEWASHAARALVGASVIGVSWPGASLANDAFAGTGIQHLVAISGFNMGVLAAVALVPLARLRMPRIEGVALVLLAAVFAASIHTEVSAVRAALMAAGVGAVRLFGLRCSGEAVVSIAAIAIVVTDAPQAANPGFQLSFAAVVGLMRVSRPLERVMMSCCRGDGLAHVLVRKAIPATSASVAAWSATAPVTVMHFGQLALWAIPVTIALSPMFAALVVAGSAAPAMHALSRPAGQVVGAFAAADAQLLVRMAALATHLPGAIVRTGTAQPAMVDPPGIVPALRIDSIDVRDGSCHLIRSPDGAILFDAGSLGSATLGSGTVVPALQALGVRHVDAVIVSHANFDHFSAMPEVIDAMGVRLVLASAHSVERARTSPRGSMAAMLRYAEDAGCAVVTVAQGDVCQVSRNMRLRVLWPPARADHEPAPPGRNRGRGTSENARSVTMLVEVASGDDVQARALMCGDLSGRGCDAVTDMVAHRAGSIHVVEVPHHGSPDPSAVRMLRSLQPHVLIQSTGMRRLQRDAIASMMEFRDPFDGSASSSPQPSIPRLVTARHGAVAAVVGIDGSLHAGRFDRDRYIWRTLMPPSGAAAAAHNDQRPVEHEHIPDASALPLADLYGERRISPRERWVEPEVDVEHGTLRIESRTEELATSLLHDDWGVRPLAKPLPDEQLPHQALAPLGDFIDEPYRPPDLQRGEAERGIRIKGLRCTGPVRRKLHIGRRVCCRHK